MIAWIYCVGCTFLCSGLLFLYLYRLNTFYYIYAFVCSYVSRLVLLGRDSLIYFWCSHVDWEFTVFLRSGSLFFILPSTFLCLPLSGPGLPLVFGCWIPCHCCLRVVYSATRCADFCHRALYQFSYLCRSTVICHFCYLPRCLVWLLPSWNYLYLCIVAEYGPFSTIVQEPFYYLAHCCCYC